MPDAAKGKERPPLDRSSENPPLWDAERLLVGYFEKR